MYILYMSLLICVEREFLGVNEGYVWSMVGEISFVKLIELFQTE